MFKDQLIRHAYEQVVTSGARLISFSTGKPPRSDGPMDERQEILALDDLASFAYHARRLIALTETEKRFKPVQFPGKMEDTKILNLLKVLHVIVHSEHVGIFRTQFKIDLVKAKKDDIVNVLLKHPRPNDNLVPTQVVIKSDRSKTIKFYLQDLIETYQEKILKVVIDVCEKREIYLEPDV